MPADTQGMDRIPTTADVEARFESLTDEQDAAASALAEFRYGVGLQGLAGEDADYRTHAAGPNNTTHVRFEQWYQYVLQESDKGAEADDAEVTVYE